MIFVTFQSMRKWIKSSVSHIWKLPNLKFKFPALAAIRNLIPKLPVLAVPTIPGLWHPLIATMFYEFVVQKKENIAFIDQRAVAAGKNGLFPLSWNRNHA